MRAERYLSGTQGTTLYSCINQDSFNCQSEKLPSSQAWKIKGLVYQGLGNKGRTITRTSVLLCLHADYFLLQIGCLLLGKECDCCGPRLTSSLLCLPLILFQKVPEKASDSPRVGVVILGSSNFHEIHPVRAGRDQAQRRGRRSFSGLTKQIIRQGCDCMTRKTCITAHHQSSDTLQVRIWVTSEGRKLQLKVRGTCSR